MRKKVIFFIVLFTILLSFSFASALTSQEKQNLINQIQQQILLLQTQLQQIQLQNQTQQSIQNPLWCYTFNQDIYYGSSGTEVYNLKTALNKQGLLDASNINFTFDTATYNAVILFQEKYKSEILSPAKLKAGTGKVGSLTRAKLNKIYSCSLISNCAPNWICSDWGSCGSNKQTRKCNDVNKCNTSFAKPQESQVCTKASIKIYANNTRSKLSIEAGNFATISWESTGVNSCNASGNWTGPKNISGSESTGNLMSSRIYNISCVNALGDVVSDSVTVDVVLPSVTLKIDGLEDLKTINQGNSGKLSWTAKGVNSCNASGDWSGVKADTGSESTGYLITPRKYTYGIICSTYTGSNVNDIVNVIVPQSSVVIKANNIENLLEISSGNSVNLTWDSTGIESCQALGDWSGIKKSSGSLTTEKIYSQKFYVIECKDFTGNKLSDSVLVKVKP